jgi:hypothetical protein
VRRTFLMRRTIAFAGDHPLLGCVHAGESSVLDPRPRCAGSSSAGEQGRSVLCGSRGSGGRGGGNVFWVQSLHCHLRGLESIVGVVTEARERGIWERADKP